MSMKDAIFGTAAPSSHGGATYRDSIQAWLPVKNIIGGVVITKDNRFIKILEVLPVNFYLKSPSDQQDYRRHLFYHHHQVYRCYLDRHYSAHQ